MADQFENEPMFEDAPLFQMPMNVAEFVYEDEDEEEGESTQPVSDIFTVGVLIDDRGDDMETKANLNLTENFTIVDPLTKARLTIFRSVIDDCPFVVQIDTDECGDADPRIRVNLNDFPVYDGHAESGETYPLV